MRHASFDSRSWADNAADGASRAAIVMPATIARVAAEVTMSFYKPLIRVIAEPRSRGRG
jgi:hypothetical protein